MAKNSQEKRGRRRLQAMPANGLKDGGFGAETVPRPLVSVPPNGHGNNFSVDFRFHRVVQSSLPVDIVVVACGILAGKLLECCQR
jgi:hypothetical protein